MIGTLATTQEKFTITPISTKAGLYFEDIGRIDLASSNWQLIIYYKLENYWHEQLAYKKCAEYLDKICTTVNTPYFLSEIDKIACINIHTQVKHMLSEIEQKNKILSHRNHFSPNLLRNRRALLNIIGNLQHTLFGVLDEDFAKSYEQEINTVHQNENHLLKLLANQTVEIYWQCG